MKLDAPWLSSPEVKQLGAAFDKAGFELRFVGGCVRDTILKRPVNELDAATIATPEQTAKLLEAAGIRAIPTGVEHGTVTALVNGKTFEITTLRKDLATDGRHATVSFGTSWEEDAERRDFTMNALYVDLGGTLYDYVNGLRDCEVKQVTFIGDAGQRIEEDYLRILRYFRFVATVGANQFDEKICATCGAKSDGLDRLSGERISTELLKLLAVDAAPALQKMQEYSVLAHVLPVAKPNVSTVHKLDQIDAPALVKLAALIGDKANADAVSARLKLSNKQSGSLALWLANYAGITPEMSAHAQQKLVRRLGADYTPTVQLAYALSDKNWNAFAPLLDMQDWEIPAFPVSAQDLMERGFSQGKPLGDALKKLEHAWEEGGYRLGRDALLAQL